MQAANDIKANRSFALCTVISTAGSTPRSASARMIVYESGTIFGTIGGGTIEFEVIKAAGESISSGKPSLYAANLGRDLGMCCGGEMKVFIEPFAKRAVVHIFGAGHVSKSLAQFLSQLDFETRVYDEREELLTVDNFPNSNIVLGDPVESISSIANQLTSNDAVVIITHLHDLDFSILSKSLDLDWGYLGLIGSKTKIKRFELRLKSDQTVDLGRWSEASAPIGLDIGSQTPAEIGVSISAELIAWRSGASE